MNTFKHKIYDYLISVGVSDAPAKYLNAFLSLLILLIVIFLIDFIIRKLLIQAFTQFTKRTKTNFDDLLIENKVPT